MSTLEGTAATVASAKAEIQYVAYSSQQESTLLPAIRQLISKDLSEPYSIYVYRFFLHGWPSLCRVALDKDGCLVGVIICKLEQHRGGPMRGYIAMLATRAEYRGQGIATNLVKLAIQKMIDEGADEIALETEIDNIPSLRIYENLGFLRTKRLHRYYLSGTTAYRLILYVKPGVPYMKTTRSYRPQTQEYYRMYGDEEYSDLENLTLEEIEQIREYEERNPDNNAYEHDQQDDQGALTGPLVPSLGNAQGQSAKNKKKKKKKKKPNERADVGGT